MKGCHSEQDFADKNLVDEDIEKFFAELKRLQYFCGMNYKIGGPWMDIWTFLKSIWNIVSKYYNLKLRNWK